MDRHTKKDARDCGKRLAKALGKSFGNCWVKKGDKNIAKIGCWDVDYNPIYGGAVITEIHNEQGGIGQPFGSRRLKPEAFCGTINFAIKSIEIDREKRKK